MDQKNFMDSLLGPDNLKKTKKSAIFVYPQYIM